MVAINLQLSGLRSSRLAARQDMLLSQFALHGVRSEHAAVEAGRERVSELKRAEQAHYLAIHDALSARLASTEDSGSLASGPWECSAPHVCVHQSSGASGSSPSLPEVYPPMQMPQNATCWNRVTSAVLHRAAACFVARAGCRLCMCVLCFDAGPA
jgi:hypothetical protein